jgi:hypothetical protein
LYAVLRIAAYVGLDDGDRAQVVGGTMADILDGRLPAEPRPPRVPELRRISGRLARVNAYVLMSFAAALGAGPPPDFGRALPFVALARAACRDPDPGEAGPALERIDSMLAAAQQLLSTNGDREQARVAGGLVSAAGVIAATEPFTAAS